MSVLRVLRAVLLALLRTALLLAGVLFLCPHIEPKSLSAAVGGLWGLVLSLYWWWCDRRRAAG